MIYEPLIVLFTIQSELLRKSSLLIPMSNNKSTYVKLFCALYSCVCIYIYT